MKRALDAADLELVKLMVMGEGLDLDDALIVHYAVQHCGRDVVKALLELRVGTATAPHLRARRWTTMVAPMRHEEELLLRLRRPPLSDGGRDHAGLRGHSSCSATRLPDPDDDDGAGRSTQGGTAAAAVAE